MTIKEISKYYDFKYIVLPENKGKYFAVANGIEFNSIIWPNKSIVII